MASFLLYIWQDFLVEESDFIFPPAGPFASRQVRLIFKVEVRRDEMESVGGGGRYVLLLEGTRWNARGGARGCPRMPQLVTVTN